MFNIEDLRRFNRIKETINTPGWQEIINEIDKQKIIEIEKWKQCPPNLEQLLFHQQKIVALDWIKGFFNNLAKLVDAELIKAQKQKQ